MSTRAHTPIHNQVSEKICASPLDAAASFGCFFTGVLNEESVFLNGVLNFLDSVWITLVRDVEAGLQAAATCTYTHMNMTQHKIFTKAKYSLLMDQKFKNDWPYTDLLVLYMYARMY